MKTISLSQGRKLDLGKTLIMGVINTSPDSFYPGSVCATLDEAVQKAREMEEEGADILDIGGESTRPGSFPVCSETEKLRVIHLIKTLRQQSSIPLSIDTYKAPLALAALEAGADIVNDISALQCDPAIAGIIAEYEAPVILMHMQGTPTTMQEQPHYKNCIEEVCTFLLDAAQKACSAGIQKQKIILDPGIGFGKRLQDNLDLIANMHIIIKLGYPVLLGLSRKSFIGLLDKKFGSQPENRLSGSLASICAAWLAGVRIFRVHDVKETVQALKVFSSLRSSVQ